MILYDYFRSSACYRVRIALNLKGLSYEKKEVHLINQGGEQHSPAYKALNPQGLVPCLVDEKISLGQSLAIIEYLEEVHPTPTLLPDSAWDKAEVRALALSIACDIHPLNNLRVLNQLRSEFSANDEEIAVWYHHWLKQGFDAFELRLSKIKRSQPVCLGSRVTLADICLIPQVYNAERFKFDLKAYPLIREINAYCTELPEFQKAAP